MERCIAKKDRDSSVRVRGNHIPNKSQYTPSEFERALMLQIPKGDVQKIIVDVRDDVFWGYVVLSSPKCAQLVLNMVEKDVIHTIYGKPLEVRGSDLVDHDTMTDPRPGVFGAIGSPLPPTRASTQ